MRGFGDVRPEEVLRHIDTSAHGAKSYLAGTIAQSVETHYRSTERWMLRPAELKTEAEILGIGGAVRAQNTLASNMTLRYKVGSHGIDMFADMVKAYPGRRFALATLISDRWLAFDRDTFIFLGGMKAISQLVLDSTPFDGWVAVVEVQTLDESVRGLGRILLPNVHAVVWTDDPTLDFVAVEREMQRSPLLISRIGAATVTVRRWANSAPTNLFAYLMKNAAVAKHREPSRFTLSGFTLKNGILRPASAVRQHEILAGIYLPELIFGGGGGRKIARKLRVYADRIVPRTLTELGTDAATSFWEVARASHGQDQHYYPILIDRSDAQLPLDSPISLAAARFQRRPTHVQATFAP